MQMATIEFSRNVLGLQKANSSEMDPQTPHPVIDIMEAQKKVTKKGGTMRLGAWNCDFLQDTKIASIYNTASIMERHRHRYEYNNTYKSQLENAGMKATGFNPETELVEAIEIPSHPWFIGVQYHPEYKSTVANPHPLFLAFIKAALKHKTKK